MTSSGFSSLLWFIAIIAMIPLALWLLKRTPMGGVSSHGLMRSIAVLPISPSQRIVTVEVGSGEGRRWLVLGVTPQSISTLHSMEPQADAPPDPHADVASPFAQLLGKLRPSKGFTGER
jgi:flagellar protein FliO/FliZ